MGSFIRHLQTRERPFAGGEADTLLVASAQHDRQAFAGLYERYFDAIYCYCRVRLGSAERAEDATQQVFLRAMEGIGRYQDTGRFRSWLFTIAHNVVASELMSRPRTASDPVTEGVIDPAAGPEADALVAIEHQALRAALAHLPPDQRRAIELRLAGLTGREIARELGRSHEAVKMLQQRALARLRIELGATEQPGARHEG